MTLIEWADESWNPIRALRKSDGKVGWHCVKVNDACKECYANHQNMVAGNNPGRNGNGIPYAADKLPLVESFLHTPTLEKPLHWKVARKIFPCSMTDLYGEWVPFIWIDQIYSVMAATPQHFYIVLTKRSMRRRDYLSDPNTKGRVLGALDAPWPLPNVIEMASFGRQKDADQELPLLLQTPAAMRGASVEPMLEAINLNHLQVATRSGDGAALCCSALSQRPDCFYNYPAKLNWVICGGESGPHARPFNLAWAESLREQCRAAGVAFFMKQLGSNPIATGKLHGSQVTVFPQSRKGGDPSEWPESLRVREFPAPPAKL